MQSDCCELREAAQRVVANTPRNVPQAAGMDELREALAEPQPIHPQAPAAHESVAYDVARRMEAAGVLPPLAVAEDPVREAARKVLAEYEADFPRKRGSTNAESDAIQRLRDALAKPAPPSLTEEERRVVQEMMRYAWAHGVPNPQNRSLCNSALEKLS